MVDGDCSTVDAKGIYYNVVGDERLSYAMFVDLVPRIFSFKRLNLAA